MGKKPTIKTTEEECEQDDRRNYLHLLRKKHNLMVNKSSVFGGDVKSITGVDFRRKWKPIPKEETTDVPLLLVTKPGGKLLV